MDNTADKSLKYITLWLWSGFVLIVAMVVIGGITRLTGSGLSMVEWQPVTGAIPPLTEQHWLAEFEKYKQSPQFMKVNYWMDLSAFKQIYWWEFIHRLLGRIIGLIFVVPFVIFYVKHWVSPKLFKRLALLFFLGALQGVVGWLMVWSGLQNQPHVSHFRLAAHLIMALVLLSAILWTIQELQLSVKKIKSRENPLWIYLCIVFLFLQIVLGAFVAGLKAGFSYNTFPLMEGNFFPSLYVLKSKPILYNGVVLQFIHRWLAWVSLLIVAQVYFKYRSVESLKPCVMALVMLMVAQMVVGVLTLVFQVPVVLGVLHQLLAILIFETSLVALYKHTH